MNLVFDTSLLETFESWPDRSEALKLAEESGFPDTSSEQWRYSPISELAALTVELVTQRPEPVSAQLEQGCAAVIHIDSGWLVGSEVAQQYSDQIEVVASYDAAATCQEPDYFAHMSRAIAPETVTISVKDSAAVAEPITIVTSANKATTLIAPSLRVRVGRGASAHFEMVSTDIDCAVMLPTLHLEAGQDSIVDFAAIQNVGRSTNIIGRVTGNVEQSATLNYAAVGLGAQYARQRVDINLTGRGSSTRVVVPSLGSQTQVSDARLFVNHIGPDTTSDLHFKNAVADSAGSIYTGLIHIHPEASGSNAVQSNRNIKLGEEAWAWSVPNLEIENNDVRCAHASTVNTIDEEQNFYLQSRGVAPRDAERLIVKGFYNEALARIQSTTVRQKATAGIAGKILEILPEEEIA